MKTIEERKAEALRLHAQGYNCAQCVAMVFDDFIESGRIAREALAASTAALGGGVGGTGHICGAASAMAVVISLVRYCSPIDKRQIYHDSAMLIDEFARRQNGKTECRELRVPGAKPCNVLITDAVEILGKHFNCEA